MLFLGSLEYPSIIILSIVLLLEGKIFFGIALWDLKPIHLLLKQLQFGLEPGELPASKWYKDLDAVFQIKF